MSGSCRNPQNEPIAQHNKTMDEQDNKLHKTLRSALIPKEALTRIEQLEGGLEHIWEYWNRNENPVAMSDALWHIIKTAEETLSPPNVQPKPSEL